MRSKIDSLILKRDRIETQIAELVSEERGSLRKQMKDLDRLLSRSNHSNRRPMSAAQRSKLSKAKKAYWANKKTANK
jgi:hypothetical protein